VYKHCDDVDSDDGVDDDVTDDVAGDDVALRAASSARMLRFRSSRINWSSDCGSANTSASDRLS